MQQWIDNFIISDRHWRSPTNKPMWADYATDQKNFTGRMFNINMEEKSNKMCFKALPVKIHRSKWQKVFLSRRQDLATVWCCLMTKSVYITPTRSHASIYYFVSNGKIALGSFLMKKSFQIIFQLCSVDNMKIIKTSAIMHYLLNVDAHG